MRTRLFQCFLILALSSIVIPQSCWCSNAEDYFREGYVASMKREWNLAIDLFSKSIGLDPDNPGFYVQRASAYQMTNRVDDAIRDYETALRLRPDYYLAMEYLAGLYETKNEHSKALEVYNRALPLIRDSKWRSIIQWKISEARKKAANVRADQGRQTNR